MKGFFTGSSVFFGSLCLYFFFVGATLLVGHCLWGLFISLIGVFTNLIHEKSK